MICTVSADDARPGLVELRAYNGTVSFEWPAALPPPPERVEVVWAPPDAPQTRTPAPLLRLRVTRSRDGDVAHAAGMRLFVSDAVVLPATLSVFSASRRRSSRVCT